MKLNIVLNIIGNAILMAIWGFIALVMAAIVVGSAGTGDYGASVFVLACVAAFVAYWHSDCVFALLPGWMDKAIRAYMRAVDQLAETIGRAVEILLVAIVFVAAIVLVIYVFGALAALPVSTLLAIIIVMMFFHGMRK
jgi:hypothetical protein